MGVPREEVSLLRKRGLDCVQRLHWLRDCKEPFLEKIIVGLAPKFIGPNEIIVHEAEEAKELLLLRRGFAQAVAADGNVVESFSDGATIGSPTLLLSRFVWPYTVRTTDCCEIQALPLKEFRMAVALHPEEGHRISRALGLGGSAAAARRGTAFVSPRAAGVRRLDLAASGGGDAGLGPGPVGAAAVASRLRRACAAGIVVGLQGEQQTGRRKAILDSTVGPAMLAEPSLAARSLSGGRRDAASGMGGEPRGILNNFKRTLVSSLAQDAPITEAAKEAEDEPAPAGGRARSLARDTSKSMLARRRGGKATVVVDPQDSCHTSFQMWAYAEQENDEASLRELAGWLDSIPFFGAMDAFCFERVLPLAERKSFKMGEHVLSEGEVPMALHVIYAGRADVMIEDNVVGTVGPKSLVGERSICRSCTGDMDEVPVCCASIIVTSPALVTIALPREKLLGVFRRDSCVSRQFEELFDRQRKERGEVGLSSTRLFQDTDPTFAEHLDVTMKLLTFNKGATIINKGEVSDEARLLCKGTVRVIRGKEDCDISSVDNMKEAVLFGVENLLGLRRSYTETVVAMSTCLVHVIYQEPLRRLLDEFPAESFVFRRMVEEGFDEQLAAQDEHSKLPEQRRTLLSSAVGDVAEVAREEREVRIIDMTRASVRMSGVLGGPGAGEAAESDSESSESSSESSESSSASSQSSCWSSSSCSSGSGARGREEAESEKITVDWGLQLIKDLQGHSIPFLKKLQAQLRPRIYLPGQSVLKQGEDMGELLVLQRGRCEVLVFGAQLDPIEGPNLIGGSLSFITAKALTTVVTKETAFVAALAKRAAGPVLDAFPGDRRALLAASSQGFEQLCDSFHQHYVGLEGLERSLAALPFLNGSTAEFLSLLATLLSPHLLLPGQVVLDGTADLMVDEEVKLYILFGGYCHQIIDGVVVGTISQKMVFGELEVFGIEESRGWHMEVKTVELCEVGTVARQDLFHALKRFPQERHRFERLVHNRLEGTVHGQVIGLSFFAGLPGHFLSKVCVLLDRRLCFQDVEVISEGETGDSMLIVNRGKVELTYQRIKMGMLWAGKCFGVAQMLGIQRDYHASLRTKGTCHLLLLSRKSLHTLAFAGSERSWMASLRQRAQATLDSELKLFDRRFRENRRAASKAAAAEAARETALTTEAGPLTLPMPSTPPSAASSARSPSHNIVRSRHGSKVGSSLKGEQLDDQGLLRCVFSAWRRASLRAHDRSHSLATPRSVTPSHIARELQDLAQPIRFSRGMRRVHLDSNADGVNTSDIWRHWAQNGRLDLWKCTAAPRWLTAVREEIPTQILALKSQARGGDSLLPGAGVSL